MLALLAACAPPAPSEQGRLLTRFTPPAAAGRDRAFAPGLHVLGTAPGRDAVLDVPPAVAGAGATRPRPLVLLLHGAGGDAGSVLPLVRRQAAARGVLLLAPTARGATWDRFAGGTYGPDVALLDSALAAVRARYVVDPARVAVAGFSDGASYALSLGLANGDLFSHVLAFSPCVVTPRVLHGRARVFLAHGTADPVLPVDQCSRRIAAGLARSGYAVRYVEFAGGHAVPPAVADTALAWFLDP